MFENFPYTNLHDLNLDWIIKRVTEAYGPDNPPENVVVSVNGETGEVILYQDAQVHLPDVTDGTWNIYRGTGTSGNVTGMQFQEHGPAQRIDGINRYNVFDAGNPPPYPVTMVNGQTGDVVINIPVQSVNGQTGNIILYQNAQIAFPDVEATTWNMYRGTGVDGTITGIQFKTGDKAERIDGGHRYKIYDEGNPPPYPVESVGTLTGAVAILDTTIVTDQGQQKLKITFPVSSVDGQTGAVSTWGYTSDTYLELPIASALAKWGIARETSAGDMGIDFEYDNNSLSGYLTFDDGVNPAVKLKILTPDDIPSSSGVVSINGMDGVVTLRGTDIAMSSTDNTTVKAAIETNAGNISTNTGDITQLKANQAVPWDATYNWEAGALCQHEGKIWVADSYNSAGTWASQSWTETNIGDEIDTVNSRVDDNDSDIATIYGDLTPASVDETGSTASYNHAAGSYFKIDGVMYKAKTAIVPTDTFTLNTNIEAVTVGGELKGLNDHIGNVGSTDLQTQITTLNGKIDSVSYIKQHVTDFTNLDSLTSPGIYVTSNMIGDCLLALANGGVYMQIYMQPYDKKIRARIKAGAAAWGNWTNIYSG